MIAGNHRAVMEIFLMLAVTRPHIDLIGSGDFPLDPRFRFLALWYGYIPYRRGSVDGRALRRALSVIRGGGVVGIFPEGGIWTDGPKETQRGVAWLAAQSGVPVIPVGFGGIDAGVERLLKLKLPRFEVRVGTPERFTAPSISRSTLDEFSERVMGQIESLIPRWDRVEKPQPEREAYSIRRRVVRAGSVVEEVEWTDARSAALSRFYHIPVLLSIFRINLLRDVSALEAWDEPVSAVELARAARRVLGYLRLRNPYLFTYRLGNETGRLLGEAFEELRDWAAAQQNDELQLIPVKRTHWSDRVEVEERPG